MSPSPRDFPDEPTQVSPDADAEAPTALSVTPTEFVTAELDETAITPKPVTSRIKAPAMRRYMFAVATDTGPRLLALADQRLSVGRLEENGLCLQHGSVSRRHAQFELTKRGLSIADLGSQNGTSVNGEPVQGQVFLKPGDVIRVGYVALFYFGFVSPDDPPQVEVINQPVVIVPNAPTPGI